MRGRPFSTVEPFVSLIGLVVGLAVLGLAGGCIVDTSAHEPGAIVEVLVRLLEDPDSDVRRNAALALGRIERLEATGPLVSRLTDPDSGVRAFSAWALGNLGEEALGQAGMSLVQRMADPSGVVKREAAKAIVAMGATQAMVEAIVELLRHPVAETRRAAVQALAGIEARSAYFALAEAVRDEDARVRQGAVAALGELAEARALPLFDERLTRDPDAGVRSEAAYRLGKLGSKREAPRLELAVATDVSVVVRGWARWALAEVRRSDDSGSGL